MQFSSVTKIFDTSFLRLVTSAFLLLGVIFGLMQPAGSGGLEGWQAVLFWVMHAVAAVPCLVASVWILERAPFKLSPWLFVALSGLLAACVLSLAALGLESLFDLVEDDGDDEVLLPASFGFAGVWIDEFSSLAPPFILAWILINLPRIQRLPDGRPAGDKNPMAGILSRLPEGLGTDLVLLSSDLHYLHVHTTRGRTMLLYNLSEAEVELNGSGIRIHRSHWVADRHVLGLRRRGTNVVCQLSGGIELPVSRRRQAEVVARYGWDARYHV